MSDATVAAATPPALPRSGNNLFDTADTKTPVIMQSRVSKDVRDSYERGDIKFMLWIFDKHEYYSRLLKPYLLKELESQHELDQERRTQAGRPSKMWDYVCATCCKWRKISNPVGQRRTRLSSES